MTNRFLISVAVAALIAGTGFANAQGTGRAVKAACRRRRDPAECAVVGARCAVRRDEVISGFAA